MYKMHPTNDWTRAFNGEFVDVHRELFPYSRALELLETVEKEFNVKEYCSGSNAAGRWIFQIFNEEFVHELAHVMNAILKETGNDGPILEVMSGDGRLSDFLTRWIERKIIATDAKSDRYNIAYPKHVERIDALKAISRYNPSLVTICWEPQWSMIGIDIVESRVPVVWIGNPDKCGHPDIFDIPHIRRRTRYALSRHDRFAAKEFRTDIFLFNCDITWFEN
ncbi:MAG: hypothetical protein RTU09_01315 [Candidatus Thorarchaeota archaeon]